MNGKIHFLNTGHSDCIIIESDGHFAMVDAGEDSEYPPDKPHLNLQGYEQEVISYLLKNCKNKEGRVRLDFILGTHAHSDHIGGFDTVINHPLIDIEKAFLRPYDESQVSVMEKKRWDNTEVYEQMAEALKSRDIQTVTDMQNCSFAFGRLKISFLNTENKKRRKKFGENISSVVTLIETSSARLVLAGDLNYEDGDEKRLANKIGKVNLLKVGHHGYFGSTSFNWAKSLRPDYAIITNSKSRIFPDVYLKLKYVAGAKILTTVDQNGIIVEINDSGALSVKTNIMCKK